MLSTAFIAGSGIFILLLGLLALYRSKNDWLKRTFFLFCLSMSLWQFSFYLSEQDTAMALLFNRLTFLWPILASLIFVVFLKYVLYGSNREANKERVRSGWNKVLLLSAVAVFLTLSGAVVKSISPRVDGLGNFAGYDVIQGALYNFYYLFFILVFSWAGWLILRLHTDPNLVTRQKGKVISVGVAAAAVVGGTTNALLPIILQTSEYSYLGSLAVIILALTLSFSIVRHKLINVPLVAARAFGYIASIITLALIYGITVIVLVDVVAGDDIQLSTLGIIGLIFVIGSMLFSPIKGHFDKLTNRLFYRDAYDDRTLIFEVNKKLVAARNFETMLRTVQAQIATYVKPEFVGFVVQPANRKHARFVGLNSNTETEGLFSHLNQLLGTNHKVVDLTSDRFQSRPIHDSIQTLRANVIAPIKITNLEGGRGFMVLGFKKSGNPYTKKDIEVIEIISSQLSVALQNVLQFEEIEKFNVTLQQKVDAATRHLRQSNEKLRALDESKDDFVSMASHQLRTPLTSVKGYLSMVLEGDAGKVNEQQRKMLEQAYISSQRMTFLIADLLNVSRLKTGKFVIEKTPVNLCEVVSQEVAQLLSTAASREISLAFTPPENFPLVPLDETKTRQVIMNFLDNAIYYTPSGGTITVDLVQNSKSVELTVTDDGMGIPKNEQHKLFTKFYRAANAKRARPDGTGLGLFMAKKVIVSQGGAIIFKSTEGKGSVFGFSIPFKS